MEIFFRAGVLTGIFTGLTLVWLIDRFGVGFSRQAAEEDDDDDGGDDDDVILRVEMSKMRRGIEVLILSSGIPY